MKTLLLMRHAKSSWSDANLSDHDRPLNERGQRDAPRMGAYLSEQECTPECILASTAIRARTTAEKVAQGCGYQGLVAEHANLYCAAEPDVLELVRNTSDAFSTILLIGHNPTWEIMLRRFTGESRRMPTAAIACIQFTRQAWSDCEYHTGVLAHFWIPRDLA